MQIKKTPANKENIFISLTTRAAKVHNTCKYRNALQKFTTLANTEMRCKNSQYLQIQKRAAKVHNTCKSSPHKQIQKRTANTHNTSKYRNALQIAHTRPGDLKPPLCDGLNDDDDDEATFRIKLIF